MTKVNAFLPHPKLIKCAADYLRGQKILYNAYFFPMKNLRGGQSMGKNILFIDDDIDTLDYLEDLISSEIEGSEVEVFTAPTLSNAISIIKNETIDLVISDLILINEKGTDLFDLLKNEDLENRPDIAFLSMANKNSFNDWDNVKKASAYFDKFSDFSKMVRFIKDRFLEEA